MILYKAIARKTSESPITHSKCTMFVEGEHYNVTPTKNPLYASVAGKFQNAKGTIRNRTHHILIEIAKNHLYFI